jgi:hypothetical protein
MISRCAAVNVPTLSLSIGTPATRVHAYSVSATYTYTA